MPRITIADIAREAGVSKTAVSLALNDKSGVSESTRSRVREVAGRLDWHPHYAARALSNATTGAFGMALARGPETVGAEPFFMSLFAGIEERLAELDRALLLQLAQDERRETQILERWAWEHRVDGVMLIDVQLEDIRIEAIAHLGVPMAAIAPEPLGSGISTLVCDEEERMRTVAGHLLELGHRHLAFLTGPARFLHVVHRSRAFVRCVEDAGGAAVLRETDYSVDAAVRLAEELAGQDPADRPSALVADNDLLAVRLMVELPRHGLRVPQDVSVAAMEDSLLCTLTTPAVTALSRDIAQQGRQLVDLLAARTVGHQADEAAGPSELRIRESTALPS